MENNSTLPSDPNHSQLPAFPVQIPEGTDLNSISDHIPSRFSPAIFEHLPNSLQKICQLIETDNDREVFLFGALGVISGILPNIQAVYDQKSYCPNLYCFLIAPFGAGKGYLNHSRFLAETIQQEIRDANKLEWDEYKAQLAANQKGAAVTKPFKRTLFFPANTSKSGLIELLHQNSESGILFETEGDSLVDALKQEHGGFSDVLRRAFHHEHITMNRRAADEFLEISTPRLSVILSATFDQYLKLIPTAENGLFSRFIHYHIGHTTNFKNTFQVSTDNLQNQIVAVSRQYSQYYHILQQRQKPVQFKWNDAQIDTFLKHWNTKKGEYSSYLSEDFSGIINRMGLIQFRISMILSCLRKMDSGSIPDVLICTETDFENSMRMMDVFLRNSLQVFEVLPANTNTAKLRQRDEELKSKAEKIALARQLHLQGWSYRNIAVEVLGKEGAHSTIFNWVNR